MVASPLHQPSGQGPQAPVVRPHITRLTPLRTEDGKIGYQWIDLIEHKLGLQKVAVESETVNFGDGVNIRYISNP